MVFLSLVLDIITVSLSVAVQLLTIEGREIYNRAVDYADGKESGAD